ncbi:MAG: fibronectin type III domain-containing protein [Candidatus Curtissbacteria bacterium]|nr:fibronectin type III domain-containing protein [Candidatus Curtissbacteria bacterium]
MNSQVQAEYEIQTFNFPNCEGLIGTPGDVAHYETGLHQIVGGPLLEGSDDVYSLDGGNFVQCFCPPTGAIGIQTNWLRTEEPIAGWFFEFGQQWNLGDYYYAAQNVDFNCQPAQGGGESTPSAQGGGNVTTPQCPPSTVQQVDQVWLSDVKPHEVTVHWANKGDAHSFHIAYGPTPNHLIWGVEVNDSNANSYTLKDLPNSDISVSVIAKASQDCGGPASAVVGQPQVLGATGTAENSLTFGLSSMLIALGIWQTQKSLAKKARV